jgi:hypothetical protein
MLSVSVRRLAETAEGGAVRLDGSNRAAGVRDVHLALDGRGREVGERDADFVGAVDDVDVGGGVIVEVNADRVLANPHLRHEYILPNMLGYRQPIMLGFRAHVDSATPARVEVNAMVVDFFGYFAELIAMPLL